jgi:ABC-2 type transport system permease protein
VTPVLALVRRELAALFGSPIAYAALIGVCVVTAIFFFEHLQLYNQMLFTFSSTSIGGVNAGEIPDTVNLWDSVFFPVMEVLGITFIGAIPLVTMRVFAEERARGTDELLFTTHLTPFRIIIAKFGVTFAFVISMVAVSFIYPATAVSRGGLGAEHLCAVFIGLTLHGIAVASIGLTCSAFTSSQLVASVTAWVIAFVWWDFGWMHPLSSEGTAAILDALALHPRYSGFASGSVSLADIAYFVALVVVAMAVTRFSFDLRRIQP